MMIGMEKHMEREMDMKMMMEMKWKKDKEIYVNM